jgi:hypothetical protein
MINCHNCINWVDESLEQIEADRTDASHIFMGCRIYGFCARTSLESCPHYIRSENLFILCSTCHLPVPKTCVSLGECANCTDTDLFCVDRCLGEDQRKYCTHFIRLHAEGAHLIDQERAFDLFPTIGMPGGKTRTAGPNDNAGSEEPQSAPDEGEDIPANDRDPESTS